MPKKISQLTAGTPIDADYAPYVDTTAVETKRFTFTVLKSFLKTYFDGLYQAALGFTPLNAANLPSASVDDEVVLFSSTTGKVLKRASTSGIAKLTSGVLSVVTAPSGTIVGTSDTQTLTAKRVTKRTGTTTSHATPTINTDNVDQYLITAQTEAITSFTTNLSGTPTEGQTLIISITGTAARAITWGASFEASTVALPTTTVTTARLDVGFIWNTVTSKWRCVAVA